MREPDPHGGRRAIARMLRIAGAVVGLADVAFLSLFALDSFSPGTALGGKFIGLGVHLLPSIVLAALTALAWRLPRFGGAMLVVAAVVPFLVLSNLAWVNALLSLPVVTAGCLFLASAWASRGPHPGNP